MYFPRTINICAPGNGASCALCCGSHNRVHPFEDRTAGKECLTARGQVRHGPCPPAEFGPLSLRYGDAMSCPYVAILDGPGERIGCRIYESAREEGPQALKFFTDTCKTFFCRAWDSLSDEEVHFAAALTADWYYYSLLIHEIVALRDLCRRHGTPESVPATELEDLKHYLEVRLNSERET
jgi:hypothetical protein